MQATSKEALFCRQTPHYEVAATPDSGINISLDWYEAGDYMDLITELTDK